MDNIVAMIFNRNKNNKNSNKNGEKRDEKNNNGDDELTIKSVSPKLDISESTIKKYLKDFDLKIEKGVGSKAVISQETFQAL